MGGGDAQGPVLECSASQYPGIVPCGRRLKAPAAVKQPCLKQKSLEYGGAASGLRPDSSDSSVMETLCVPITELSLYFGGVCGRSGRPAALVKRGRGQAALAQTPPKMPHRLHAKPSLIRPLIQWLFSDIIFFRLTVIKPQRLNFIRSKLQSKLFPN